MKPFKGGNDPACALCDEECCFGCEVASREIDPDYDFEGREEEDDGIESDCNKTAPSD